MANCPRSSISVEECSFDTDYLADFTNVQFLKLPKLREMPSRECPEDTSDIFKDSGFEDENYFYLDDDYLLLPNAVTITDNNSGERNSTGSFLTSTPKKIQCLTNHQSGSKKPTIDDLSNKRTCKRNILDKTPSIIDLESGRKLNKRIKRPESYTVELDESVCSDHVPTEVSFEIGLGDKKISGSFQIH